MLGDIAACQSPQELLHAAGLQQVMMFVSGCRDRPKRRSTRFAAGNAQRKEESPAAAEKVEERRLSLQALTLR